MSAIFALSEDENYIYIKNLKIQLIISISKINAQIILLNEQTSKVILINNENLFFIHLNWLKKYIQSFK